MIVLNLNFEIDDCVLTVHNHGFDVISGNTYKCTVDFDEDWQACDDVFARITWGSKFYDVPFKREVGFFTFAVPIGVPEIKIGIYSEMEKLSTTESVIKVTKSVIDDGGDYVEFNGALFDQYRKFVNGYVDGSKHGKTDIKVGIGQNVSGEYKVTYEGELVSMNPLNSKRDDPNIPNSDTGTAGSPEPTSDDIAKLKDNFIDDIWKTNKQDTFIGDMYVCMVDDEGSTKHRLNPNDFSVDVDGHKIPIEDYKLYQIMLAIPKKYVVHDKGFQISDSAKDKAECLAHTLTIDGRDEEYDELLIGMYPTGKLEYVEDGQTVIKIGSYTSPPTDEDWTNRIPVKPVSSKDSVDGLGLTRAGFRQVYMGKNKYVVGGCRFADKNGKSVWMQMNWYQYQLIRDYITAIIGSVDSQYKYGIGYDRTKISTDDDFATSGLCDKLGQFIGTSYGDNSTRAYKVPVKCLIENPWANVWQYLDDVFVEPSKSMLGENVEADTIDIYVGHNHPDAYGEELDKDSYAFMNSASDFCIPAKPKTGTEWIDGMIGVPDTSKITSSEWQQFIDDIGKCRQNREKVVSVPVKWTSGNNPYLVASDKVPLTMVESGHGYGIPNVFDGGSRNMKTTGGYGLCDHCFFNASRKGSSMFGGRAGHGTGSGLYAFSFAPELRNRSLNHGSRIVMLRRNAPSPNISRTAMVKLTDGVGTLENVSEIVSVKIDGSSVQTWYEIEDGHCTFKGLEGYDEITVIYR